MFLTDPCLHHLQTLQTECSLFALYRVTFNHHYALENSITYGDDESRSFVHVAAFKKPFEKQNKKKISMGGLQVVTVESVLDAGIHPLKSINAIINGTRS